MTRSTTCCGRSNPWRTARGTTYPAAERARRLMLECMHGVVQEGPETHRGSDGEDEPGSRRPVGQMSELRAGDLPQGTRSQPSGVSQVRAPLPDECRRPAGAAV